MIKEKNNLNLIQVLRGVASLFVVFFHATSLSNEVLNNSFLFNFFGFGSAGVDIFFVLSGFIITYTSIKGAGHAGKFLPFLRRRIVRIYPTYWIIATGFLLLQFLLPAFYKTRFDFDFANLLSTYLLLPGHDMVNGVSWTLSYELFFYLLFALVFIIPSKKLSFLIFIIYAILLTAWAISGTSVLAGNNWFNMIMSPMNLEFFMGVFAALIIPKIRSELALPFLIAGSVLFISSGIFTNNGYQLLPGTFNRVFLFGVPSFFIISGLVKYELVKNVSVDRISLALGEASYSLYLVHLPLIAAFSKLILVTGISNGILIQFLMIIVIIAICYASVLFYRLIEKPIIKKLTVSKVGKGK